LKNQTIFRAKLRCGTDALFRSLAKVNGNGGSWLKPVQPHPLPALHSRANRQISAASYSGAPSSISTAMVFGSSPKVTIDDGGPINSEGQGLSTPR